MAVVSLGLGGLAASAITQGEGFATTATVKRGGGPETCELGLARAVIVTEEGSGRSFYYAYDTAEKAQKYFNSWSWKAFSRILFECMEGTAWHEVVVGGPALPHNTIRRAAKTLAIHGKIFIKKGIVGFESVHFVSHNEAFISYESEHCKGWTFDDGTALPARHVFQDAVFDAETRRFQGTINWAPKKFNGDEKWEFDMIFDKNYMQVVDGCIHHYTPGFTDKGAPGQVLKLAEADSRADGQETVAYKRWLFDERPRRGTEESSSLVGWEERPSVRRSSIPATAEEAHAWPLATDVSLDE